MYNSVHPKARKNWNIAVSLILEPCRVKKKEPGDTEGVNGAAYVLCS